MSQQVQSLGQIFPPANVEVALNSVPASSYGAVCGKFYACNQTSSADSIFVRYAVNNAASTSAQYLVYGMSIDGNDTQALPIWDASAGDIVYCKSQNGGVSFQAFGSVFSQ